MSTTRATYLLASVRASGHTPTPPSDAASVREENLGSEESLPRVTPDMVERQGQWSEPRSSYPIGQSDIRRWAIATYWPEKPPPVYWDEEYARSTRWGGIIAPEDFSI